MSVCDLTRYRLAEHARRRMSDTDTDLQHRDQQGWHRVAWLLEELKVQYQVKRYADRVRACFAGTRC